MWSMIVINELPDYKEDLRSGKLNLVARFGRRRGVVLYAAGLIFAYSTLLLCAYFRLTSLSIVLGLLAVPIAYGAFRILKDHYMDKIKMPLANFATIKVHALTMICLIIGYIADGIMSR